MVKFNERIKELREEKNLDQKEFAKICGVQQSCVSKWERGATIPDLDIIIFLAKHFQVTTDYLLGLED